MSPLTSPAIELVLASMAFAIALFGALSVATAKVTRGRATGLVIFLAIAASDSLDDLLAGLGVYRSTPDLIGWAWPWPILYGPALYLYLREMTSARPVDSSARRWLPFALPTAAALALATPFYLQDATLKLALASGRPDALSDAPDTLRWCLNGLYVLFFAISFGYLVAMFGELSRHVERVRDLFSNIEDRSLSWLRSMMLVLCAAWLWAGALWWFSELDGASPSLERSRLAFHLVWVSCFAAFGAVQGPALVVEPGRGEDAGDPGDGIGQLFGQGNEGNRYARSGLTDTRMRRIAARLRQAMVEESLYRDPQLSLRVLSNEIGVSENYVSQTLNVEIGQKFFDFVNAYRVDAAKRELLLGNDTTLAVALDVGFNSRSTFNAAFRKHAGTTPSAYRARARTGVSGSGTDAPTEDGPAHVGRTLP